MGLLDIILRIGVSAAVGAIVGLQREYKRNAAGFRTHMLVAIGACIAMLTNEYLLLKFSDVSNMDVSRMASYVISGIGFLGAGSIIKEKKGIKGLTTAAGLWVTACLGITAGAGFYWIALIGSAFVFVIVAVFKIVEKKLFKSKREVVVIVKEKGSELTGFLKELKTIDAKVKEVEKIPVQEGEEASMVRFSLVGGKRTDIMIMLSEKLNAYDIVNIKITSS